MNKELINGVTIDTSKENPIIIENSDITRILEWRHSIIEHFNVYVQIKCQQCGKVVIKNIARTKEKYCSIKFLSYCRACSQRNSNIEKYGVENVFQLDNIKQKAKETCKERYGSDSYKSSNIGKDAFKQYSLNRYGVENPFQVDEVKLKSKETLLNKYGVEHPLKSKEIRKQQEQTFIDRYNVKHALQNPYFLKKAQNTMLNRFGVSNAMYSDELKEKCILSNTKAFCKNTFIYNNTKFDSSWELYFYLYHKLLGKNIIRNTNVFLTYQDEYSRYHKYIPDFIMDNQFYEIKGEQFIIRDNKNNVCNLRNPYNESLNYISESKYQCMVQNGVNIITIFEIDKIIDFIDTKYGADYISTFKSIME